MLRVLQVVLCGFAVMTSLAGIETASAVPPPNDACATAAIIGSNVTDFNPILLDTSEATVFSCENQEDCASEAVGHTVWYLFTPSSAGVITVDTVGSNYDTVVSVFENGCAGTLFMECQQRTQIACGDSGALFSAFVSNVPVAAGVPYSIKVSSHAPGGGGLLDFNFMFRSPPPNDTCANATEILGTMYNPPLVDTTDATVNTCEAQETCESNANGVSNSVWYRYIPPSDGMLNIDTRSSNYDTVLSVWNGCGEFVGPDDPCTMPAQLACNDDIHDADRDSELLNVPVQGGVEYFIKVADYNVSPGGGALDFNLSFHASSEPIAEITAPAPFTCICSNTPVFGTANSSVPNEFSRYELTHQPLSGGAWVPFGSGTNPVSNNLLGTFNPAGLIPGHYFLRLTSEIVFGGVDSAVALVIVDGPFDLLAVTAPPHQSVVGGEVCVEGSADDSCFEHYTVGFRPAFTGAFTPVDPLDPQYLTPQTNSLLATWDTAGLADGNYDLQVRGEDLCVHSQTITHVLTVDNTPPTAIITQPAACAHVGGFVSIQGTANDANLAGWELQYSGGAEDNWVTIASGNAPVINGQLGQWNTTTLPECSYVLRLVVTDDAVVDCGMGHRSEFVMTLSTETGGGGGLATCPVDFDGDLDQDLLDYAEFQNCFDGP